MSNAMDNLYNVQNGVNTVNAADHNTLVSSSNFLYNGLGGFYNFQNGRDGHVYLGSISATTSTAPTVALNGSGNLTAATFYYKYSAYNLSGETAASSASSSIAVSSQQVAVTIPGTANATNITGFYVYRSTSSGGTYYRVGQVTVDNPMNGAVFYDNYPITSGTAPQGSNTTSASATFDGFLYCRDFTMTSGQTLTLTTSTPVGLFICAQGNISIGSGATIAADGKGSGANKVASATSVSISGGAGTVPIGANGSASNDSDPGGQAVFADSNAVRAMLLKKWNAAGKGGGTTPGNPGGSICLISQTQITCAGTINASGANATGTSGGAGGAGGTVAMIAPYINRASATITANGGNGVAGPGYGGSGGGGGTIAFISDYLTGTATTSVNGGTDGADGGVGVGGQGGGNGGSGGGRSAAGSVGLVATATIAQTDLRN